MMHFKPGRVRWISLIMVSFFLLSAAPAGASAKKAFDPGIGSIEQSKAYQLFLTRQYSELSKLIYLVDRFKEAKIQIIYDKLYYEPAFVARVAKWFLPSHYKNEKAEQWVMQYCNTSYLERQLIWVKDSKDRYKLSRELLLDELKLLRETYLKDPKFKGETKK